MVHRDIFSDLPQDHKRIWDLAWDHAMGNETIIQDIDRSQKLDVKNVTDSGFLHECAWAIFGGGFRISILERIFPRLKEAYLSFDLNQIAQHAQQVEKNALQAFGNKRKVKAVLKIADIINSQGWPKVRSDLLELPEWDAQGNPWVSQSLLDYLDEFPQVGQTLASYIAKNIGVSSIKPDIWMLRLAEHLGHEYNVSGVWDMARAMRSINGETINVIDTVLWNWARDDWNVRN